MFISTEPVFSGKSYTALRVVFGVGSTYELSTADDRVVLAWNSVISNALAALEQQARQAGADGVIGIHLSTSETGCYFHAAVMGTAIKF